MNKTLHTKRTLDSIAKQNNGKFDAYLLPVNETKKINGYMGIRQDLNLAKDALNIINKKTEKVICNSLYYTFIGLYGRCFTESKSGYPCLQLSDFSGRPDLLLLHKVKSTRNMNLVVRCRSLPQKRAE